MVVFGIGIAGGAAALFGARYGLSKFSGKKRDKANLNDQERRVLDTCMSLAVSFRQYHKANKALDLVSAAALYNQVVQPLSNEIDDCLNKTVDWPPLAVRRLRKKSQAFTELKQFLRRSINDAGFKSSMIGVPVATGIVSATILKLLSQELPEFTETEEFVLQALRRSNKNLLDASNEDLSQYVKSMDVEQLGGLTSNVKGIYHELSFQNAENTDGDEYIVELFEATNHPGADVRIINTLTGDVTEAQLKATNYASYVQEHNAKYEDISIFATSEVADADPLIASSGFSNKDMTGDTETVFGKLDIDGSPQVLDSMGVAAMVILARNAGALLKGDKIPSAKKERMIQDGIVAASVAGLTSLIL